MSALRSGLVGFGVIAGIGIVLIALGWFTLVGWGLLIASVPVGLFAWWATNDRL